MPNMERCRLSIIAFALLQLSIVPHCQAWFWPFSSPAPSRPELSQTAGTPPSSTGRPQRPCRFQTPYQASNGAMQKVLESMNEKSSCRYELARQLIEQTESCSSTISLQEFARVATVCHYRHSGREDRIPLHCLDKTCIHDMTTETFQVYTAFHLHAEHICRELNSKLWMESVEDMILALGRLGEDALVSIESLHGETRDLMLKQVNQLESLGLTVDHLHSKQREQFRIQEDHFRRSQKSISEHQAQVERIQQQLTALQTAMSNFDDIVAVLGDIQQSMLHQNWSLLGLIQAAIFHACFYLLKSVHISLMATGMTDIRDIANRLFVWAWTSCILCEIVVGFDLMPYPQNQADLMWKIRYRHISAVLLLNMFVILTSVLNRLKNLISARCSRRGPDLTENHDAIRALINDIVILHSMRYAQQAHGDLILSDELISMREEPPPGYRRVEPLRDGVPLDVSLYSASSSSSSFSSSDFEDDDGCFPACDAPHCIAAQ